MDLDSRKLRILGTIVEQYVNTAEPVGSKKIAELLNINISSATIRNDMATLFDMGFLEQPHTSAGRIPSHLGYRLYVNEIMNCVPLSSEQMAEIQSMFNIMSPDPDKLLKGAAAALADLTNCATFATTFTPETIHISKLQLIPANDNTVIILIIASNGVIKNKVCRVMFRVTSQICEFFTSFVNYRLQGRSLNEISMWYLSSISVDLGEYSRMFNPLLGSVYELCKEINDGQFYMEGQTNLLSYPELSNMVGDMLVLFTDKQKILDILPKDNNDIDVVIGKENNSMELSGSSVLLARYDIGGQKCGTIGLIGPIRLDYARVVPKLQYFANILSSLLTDAFGQQEPRGE